MKTGRVQTHTRSARRADRLAAAAPDNVSHSTRETLFTEAVIDRGWVIDQDKARREVSGAVSKMEAETLAELIQRYDCRRCLETGVAYGVSTLAICQAVAANGGHHFGVDPCQITEHGRSAMCLLDEFGLADCFTLLEGPSHAELPKLLEDHQDSFDLIFVDGWHTFDCKLLDYVYADKLLRVGGWLVFHDLLLPSVKRTLRFIRTQGKYEIHCHGLEHVSWIRRARYAIAALIKRRPLWYYWPCSFSNLLVLRKASATSPAWNHHASF